MRPLQLLCLASMAATAQTHAQPATQGGDAARVPVVDLRVLMVAAIDSPAGVARGILTSKDAENISRHFKATGPILIDITTLKRYAQAGCSRLNLSISQDGVVLPGRAAPQRQTVDFGINYCRDGQPPKSLS